MLAMSNILKGGHMLNHSINTMEQQIKNGIFGDPKTILATFHLFNLKFKELDKRVHETIVNESEYLRLQQGKPISPLFQSIANDYKKIVSEYQEYMQRIQFRLKNILSEQDIQGIKESLNAIQNTNINSPKLRFFPSYQDHYHIELTKRKNVAQQELTKMTQAVNPKIANINKSYNSRLEDAKFWAHCGGFLSIAGIGIPILLLTGLIVLTDTLITKLRIHVHEKDIQSAQQKLDTTDLMLRNEIKNSIDKNTGNQIHQRFFKLEKNKVKLELLAKEVPRGKITKSI